MPAKMPEGEANAVPLRIRTSQRMRDEMEKAAAQEGKSLSAITKEGIQMWLDAQKAKAD